MQKCAFMYVAWLHGEPFVEIRWCELLIRMMALIDKLTLQKEQGIPFESSYFELNGEDLPILNRSAFK